MSTWQRPSHASIPKGQAVTDRLRRIDPRRLARHILVCSAIALVAQLGWQWRATTLQLGRTEHLMVVDRPVEAGADITNADLRSVSWPVGLIPSGALRALPSDAVAAADLVPGEVLVSARLVQSATDLEPGQRLVTVAQPLAAPPVERGSKVELFGIMALGDGLTSPAHRLASGTVIEISETSVAVAVDASAVPTIVEHAALGTIDIVIVR